MIDQTTIIGNDLEMTASSEDVKSATQSNQKQALRFFGSIQNISQKMKI
jgi:hypothetical protein